MDTTSKVTNRSGWPVKPDSLLMKSLCNADNQPGDIDRSRYIVTPTPPQPANAWDRCSGSSTTD